MIMSAWGKLSDETEAKAETRNTPKASVPVTFADTVGLYEPAVGAASSTGVLFLSSWGYEEMCVRKFWRILAESMAEAGIPNLRFDYMGTGDALNPADDLRGMALWEDSALAAAEKLKALSGCKTILLVGQGLGCAISTRIAARLSDIAGIAFLAPLLSGRFYLREIMVWSRMIDESMGLGEEERDTEGVTIAGLKMPETIAADIRRFNMMSLTELAAPAALVLGRPGRPGDPEFADHLEKLGLRVEHGKYEGYEELAANPTMAVMPLRTGERVVAWAKSLSGPATTAKQPALPAVVPLTGAHFRETPLRFGNDRLFGILCEPNGERVGSTAILLTTAYDRSAGWARTSVEMARNLARDGIASLRFDTANVGDSPAMPGAPDQVLYARSQMADVTDAFDFLEEHQLLPAFVVGRCSGGYLAFKGAIEEARCTGMISVNPYTLHWDNRQSVDIALRFIPRSLATYRQKFLRIETLKRLFSGKIDIKSAVVNITTSLLARISRWKRPLLEAFPFLSREHNAMIAGFHSLSKRDVAISLIYSAEDIGLEQFREHFGQKPDCLKAFPGARLTIIEDADHNLTPAHAREIYVGEIRNMALRTKRQAPAAETGPESLPVKTQPYAGCPTS
jgi:pimeloyl-ACP methyl ester carboxylesterase